MEKGASSALRTEVRALREAMSVDSGAWKAGFREVIMEGVRMRTEGLGMSCLVFGCRCGCGSGREVRSGRNTCRISIGVRSRVLRRSLRVTGESVAIGEVGYDVGGTIIKDRSVR